MLIFDMILITGYSHRSSPADISEFDKINKIPICIRYFLHTVDWCAHVRQKNTCLKKNARKLVYFFRL